MGLCSHNGLLVMLLFHLCQAQDDALPSPDPEPAPPSLGDVIDAVKAAIEQAGQISTTGTVHQALEQVVGELSPQKTPDVQSPVETAADYTTEVAAEKEAVVITEGETDANFLESSEQTFEEPAQESLSQAIELAEENQGLIPQDESSISEPGEKSLIKPGGLFFKAVDSVQEPLESDLRDPEIVEERKPVTDKSHADESPVQMFPDTQKEEQSERGAAEMQVVEDEHVEEPAQGFAKNEAQLSQTEEKTAKGEIEKVEMMIRGGQVILQGQEESVERQDTEWDKISEHSQEEWQAVTAQMGPDGGVVDMDGAEQEEEEQEVAETEEGVIEVEARREDVEAQLQKVSKKEEVYPTDKTVLEKTREEPEVTVDTQGPIKLQEPVITKSKATGGEALDDTNFLSNLSPPVYLQHNECVDTSSDFTGKTHEASDVNEIITSRDPNKNNQGEPVLMNTVEELSPTPALKLRLENTEASLEENVDSTQTKAIGQETWKIGAIAAAFFLILQTAVTIVYILKCRRKPNSRVASKNLCAGGNRGIECDANNTDTTIPIDEQTAVDDLPEYSEVQQEDVAMTTIPLESTERNSSYDPRTSVV